MPECMASQSWQTFVNRADGRAFRISRNGAKVGQRGCGAPGLAAPAAASSMAAVLFCGPGGGLWREVSTCVSPLQLCNERDFLPRERQVEAFSGFQSPGVPGL